jgi:hypothetical protein
MTNQIRVFTAVLANDTVEIIDNQGDMHIIPSCEISDWEQTLPVWESPTYSGWGDLDGPEPHEPSTNEFVDVDDLDLLMDEAFMNRTIYAS